MSESPTAHIPHGNNLVQEVKKDDLMSNPEMLAQMWETLSDQDEAAVKEFSAQLNTVETVADLQHKIVRERACQEVINEAERIDFYRNYVPVYEGKK